MVDLAKASNVDPAILALAEATLIGSSVARHFGIHLLRMTQGTALLALPFSPANVTIADVVHGGVIATLADIAAVCAAITRADSATLSGVATSSMAISYLRAANGVDLEARAQILRASRRQIVCRVTIGEAEAESIAEALVTVALFSSHKSATDSI